MKNARAWAWVALDYYTRAPVGGYIDRAKWRVFDQLDMRGLEPGVVPVRELAASDYSFTALRSLSEDFRYPVVIRGLFAHVPAIERWKSPEYLLAYGDEVYLVSQNGRVRDQTEAARNDAKNMEDQLPYTEMPLREIIARMEAGEQLYVAALDTIFHRDPRLLADLMIPKVVTEWWEGKDVPLDPVMVQMFMGVGTGEHDSTTGSGLHCARHANFFIQVVGTKHWTLVDPRHSLFLHPSPRYALPACAATPPIALDELPHYSFTIHPGDVLLNPPWMWHAVHNGPGWTIGCATREVRFWATLRNNPVLTLMQEFTEMNSNFAARMTTRPVARMLRSLPLFMLGAGLLQEATRGYVNPPMRAYANADEHDEPPPSVVNNLDTAIKSWAR
jgi:hypothetical protein